MPPAPRTINFSLTLVEALALSHIRAINNEVRVVVAGSLLVTVVWLLL